MIGLLPILPKPRFGEPCNGCGYCCKQEVCEVGKAVFGENAPAPCPGLEVKAGRYICSLFELASEEHRLFLMWRMGIGMGCDSEDE